VKRRPAPAPNLTSLLDVLFILIFATLVQLAGRREVTEAAAAPPVTPAPPQPPAEVVALRARAVAELSGRPTLIARIRADGTLTRLESEAKSVDLDVPLLEHVPDPDVAVAYLGDRSADQRLCRIAALHLGLADLAGYLVVFSADVPLAELPHALFDGLHHDADRCLVEQHGVAVVVDRASVP
jgi:hypothetical protein